jgi:hypothetical protein
MNQEDKPACEFCGDTGYRTKGERCFCRVAQELWLENKTVVSGEIISIETEDN